MFKVILGGVEIQCETADDAIELAARVGDGGKRSPSQKEAREAGGNSRWTTQRLQNLLGQLQDKPKRFLAELVRNSDGVTDTAMRQALGLTSNKAFGPILTSISRKSKKVGVSLQEVYTSEKLNLGGETVLEFKVNPSFAKIYRDSGNGQA
jgi:hypothetical protein